MPPTMPFPFNRPVAPRTKLTKEMALAWIETTRPAPTHPNAPFDYYNPPKRVTIQKKQQKKVPKKMTAVYRT